MALLNDDEEERRAEEEEEDEDLFEIDIPEPGETPLEDLGVDDGFDMLEGGWRDRPELTGGIDQIRRAGGLAPLYESESDSSGRLRDPVLRGAIDQMAAAHGAEPVYGDSTVRLPEQRIESGVVYMPETEIVAGVDYESDEQDIVEPAPLAPRPEREPNAGVRYDAQEAVSPYEEISPGRRMRVTENANPGPGEANMTFTEEEAWSREPGTDGADMDISWSDAAPRNEPLRPLVTYEDMGPGRRMRVTENAAPGPDAADMIFAEERLVERPGTGGADADYSWEAVGAETAPPSPGESPQGKAGQRATRAQGLGNPSAPASRARERLGDPSVSPREVVETGAGLARGPREQLREDIAELERLRQEPDRTGRDIGRVFQRIVNAIGRGMQVVGGQRPGPNLLAQRFAAEDARDERERARRMSARQDILRRRMAADERAAARDERRAERAEDRSARQRERAQDRNFRREEGKANRGVQRERLAQQNRIAADRQATQNWIAKRRANQEDALLPARLGLMEARTGQANRSNQGPRAGGGGRGRGARGRGAAVPLDATAAGVLSALDAITPETSETDFNSAISAAARMAENRRLPASVRSDLIEGVRRAQRARGAAGQEGPEILPGVHRSVGEGGAPRVELADREIRDARDALADYQELSRAIQQMGSIAQRARRIVEEQGLNGWRSEAMMALRQEQNANLEAFERLFQRSMGALTEADVRRLFGRVPIPVPNALDYAGMALSEGNLFNPIELAERGIAAQRERLADTVRTTADRYGLVADEAIGYVTGRRRANRRPRESSAQRQPRRPGLSALRAAVQRGRQARPPRSDERIRRDLEEALEGRGVPADLIDEAFQ